MSTPREILQIAGCQLWLDGADTGSMTFSGSEVRQWRDKSGNSRHATPSGTGPTYTQNVFNGRAAPVFGNTAMLTPSFVLSATNRMTLFAVFLQTGPNGRGNSEIIFSPVSYLYFDLYVRTSNVGELVFVVNGISYFLTVTDISQLNTMTSHVSDGSTYTGFLNGTQAATGSLGTINYSLNTSSTLSITTSNYIGPLCEILFYNTNLSTTTRQFIEGYLAWKWGTQTSLPLAHPYKTAAPFLTTWSPLVTIPRGLSLIPVNTLSTIKTLALPVVSSNPGLLLILKDHLGYSSTNPISLSTVGLDRIERNNISSMILSNSFGAWTFQNDGRTNWFLLNVYTNNVYLAPTVFAVIVTSGLVNNVDAATYSSGSTWTALVGNNQTVYNSPGTTTTPGGQTAIVFNGSSYGLDTTGIASSGIQSFTMDAWFNAAAGVSANIVGELGQNTQGGWNVMMIAISGNIIYVGFWQGSVYQLNCGSYSANTWTHVSYTYSGTTVIGYVNGVQVATGTASKQWPGTAYYGVGSAANPYTNFTGAIGAYKLYNRALTAAEVRQNYNALATRFGRPTI